jgi:hypothetical protein
VNGHDFPGAAECRAVPYGVYNHGRDRGGAPGGGSVVDEPGESALAFGRPPGAGANPASSDACATGRVGPNVGSCSVGTSASPCGPGKGC